MLGNSPNISYQVSKYYDEKVSARRALVQSRIDRLIPEITKIIKMVETHEPRFICNIALNEQTGRYNGLIVHSPTEFELIFYLNQMGVFNFVDDGSIPGCAVLKLSDGRKRSMSLWVEFITASGYLSARKLRGRFHQLVQQTVEKLPHVQLQQESSDVCVVVDGCFSVQITCSFECRGIWPRSAAHWPPPQFMWPLPQIVQQVKTEGFELCSRDMTALLPVAKNGSQGSSMEGDAFAMSMSIVEQILLMGQRRRCFSILKSLRDSHLSPLSPVSNYMLKTLFFFECEKHPNDYEWEDECIGDRLIGVLLQLVSCLQCRRCPHYFLPHLDLLRGKSYAAQDAAAKEVWSLTRQLMLDANALETL